MKDILSGLAYVLKTSTALLESLNSLNIDQSCILVTGDVKSLYTNISVQDAIVAVSSICREFEMKETSLLIEMLTLVLTNNFIHCSELNISSNMGTSYWNSNCSGHTLDLYVLACETLSEEIRSLH